MTDAAKRIDRVAIKKQAKQILDSKTLFLIGCFFLYSFVLAACFLCCFAVPNPLEDIVVDLVSETYLFSRILDYQILDSICFWFFKFLRAVLFVSVSYPFSVCMAKIPMSIVDGETVTWSNVFEPICRGRYFIEYMIAGFSKFFFVFFQFIFLFFPGIIAHYRYSFVKYFFVENPELTSGEAFSVSRNTVYGYKSQLFTLDLSFLGWFLFGVCTCGVGFLYLYCYYSVTKVLYYREICGYFASSKKEEAGQ